MKQIVTFGLCAALISSVIVTAGCSDTRKKMQMKSFKIKTITAENVHGVMAPDDDHIWIVGNYGIIYHSSDGGATWTKQQSGIKDAVLVDGIFLDNREGWVAGMFGTVLHTDNGGGTWTKQTTGTQRHLFDVSFVDRQYGWAIGEWGTIIHTTDGGTTWAAQGEESDKIYNNVCFVDRHTGWIVGEQGIILHTRDGGATWARQMPRQFERESLEDELENPRPPLFCIQFKDAHNGWICGIDGTIMKTSDGGATWHFIAPITDLALYTIFLQNGKAYIVGDKGAYLTSEDSGTTWALKTDVIKSKQPFRDVWFSSPGKGWIVGAAGTVVHTTDGGTTWDFYSGLSYAMEFFQMPKALEFGGGVE